jgi:hypothetical protein
MSEMCPIAAVGQVHELLCTPVNAESPAFEHPAQLRQTAEQFDPVQRWYRILSEALKRYLKGRQPGLPWERPDAADEFQIAHQIAHPSAPQ